MRPVVHLRCLGATALKQTPQPGILIAICLQMQVPGFAGGLHHLHHTGLLPGSHRPLHASACSSAGRGAKSCWRPVACQWPWLGHSRRCLGDCCCSGGGHMIAGASSVITPDYSSMVLTEWRVKPMCLSADHVRHRWVIRCHAHQQKGSKPSSEAGHAL